MPNVIIYFNPQCSKSRQTLQLLRDQQIVPEVIEYLQTPPTHKELSDILQLLKLEPRQLMRTKESAYQQNNLDDDNLTEQQLIEAMVLHPILIERPIVIHNNKATLGRPPENILEIL